MNIVRPVGTHLQRRVGIELELGDLLGPGREAEVFLLDAVVEDGA